MEELDILILGAGWTATFLIPLLTERKISFAATTTTGRTVADHPTIPFKFDPSDENIKSRIAALPRARTIVITFPLTGEGPSRLLAETYENTHLRSSSCSPSSNSLPANDSPKHFHFIQLGSTGVWQPSGPLATPSPSPESDSQPNKDKSPWITRHAPLSLPSAPRTVAETELLSLGGCVLHLAGLWDGEKRMPSHWIDRVASSKEALRSKGSLHMIHGIDVARAILAVSQVDDEKWSEKCKGQRWMLTDGFVYDWWALLVGWADIKKEDREKGEPTKQAKWVYELMLEEGVRGLPRSMEQLKRCYDTREFWSTFDLVPLKGRMF
ncbi:hypothetical protein V8F20_001672 [Naviculisporaceae sp. PSN 640]